MIETKDYEIIVIEKEQLNKDIIKTYIESQFANIYMVILDNGKFLGFFDNIILLEEMEQDKFWREDCLVLDPSQNSRHIFNEAREYFSTITNRKFPLPVISLNGQVLTFFVWNQHLEKPDNYLENQKYKILELLENGYYLEFKNWDEYTNEYICSIREKGSYSYNEHIKFSGRNWELYNMLENYIVSTHLDNDMKKDKIMVDNRGIYYPVKEHNVIPLVDIIEGRKRFENKKLYAWLYQGKLAYIGKIVFQYGYLLEGFCELSESKEIEYLLGKKVRNLEEIIQQDDVVVIVYNEVEKNEIKKRFSEGNVLIWSELFNSKHDIENKEGFQTWGNRWEVAALKKTTNIKVICENSKVERQENAILCWEFLECRKTPENYSDYMLQINPRVKWYSKERVFETMGRMASDPLKVKNFDMALEHHKKFFIYGIESHYTNQWIHLLETMRIEFEFLEDEEIQDWYGYHVLSVFDLPFYNLDQIFVIINKPYEKLNDAIDILDSYGISFERNNSICIYDHIVNLNQGKSLVDICAGPIPEILVKSSCPGYFVIGDGEKENYKIMILGGSTSSSVLYNYRSWPEFLGRQLKATGKNVIILNGAVGGYSSIRECTKLIRDIKYIKPDMVISFSGVNDFAGMNLDGPKGYTFGLEEGSIINWLQNERMMKIICEQYGAKFYCFAQPQIYHKSFNDKYWKLFSKRNLEAYPDWKEGIEKQKNCTWLINLLDILDEHLDVYFDACHVTDEGNQIIAKHIYNYIIDDIMI